MEHSSKTITTHTITMSNGEATRIMEGLIAFGVDENHPKLGDLYKTLGWRNSNW